MCPVPLPARQVDAVRRDVRAASALESRRSGGGRCRCVPARPRSSPDLRALPQDPDGRRPVATEGSAMPRRRNRRPRPYPAAPLLHRRPCSTGHPRHILPRHRAQCLPRNRAAPPKHLKWRWRSPPAPRNPGWSFRGCHPGIPARQNPACSQVGWRSIRCRRRHIEPRGLLPEHRHPQLRTGLRSSDRSGARHSPGNTVSSRSPPSGSTAMPHINPQFRRCLGPNPRAELLFPRYASAMVRKQRFGGRT